MRLSLALLLLAGATPVTRVVHVMGTRAVLTGDEAQLENYIRILEATEDELSVWRPDTVLSRLNSTPVAREFSVDPQLFRLLETVQHWSKESDHAFDPAIGKLLQARGFYGKTAVSSAVAEIGMQHIVLDSASQTVTRRRDVWLDSGAFGKGEALDRVLRQAVRDKASPWLIDLGGQVMVYGLPPGESSWPVDIAHPQKRDVPVMTLQLKSGSISTSGNSEQPGHIVDPSTGSAVEFSGSVVVWNESALLADILDTALFVMGPTKGLAWAEARGIAACFLIPNKDKVRMLRTSAFVLPYPDSCRNRE